MTDDLEAGAGRPVPAPVATVLAAADRLAVLGGWLAAACLAALTILICSEIVVAATSRVFRSLPGGISFAWEYSAYLMGSAFLLGAGVTLRAGSHIRMGVLTAGAPPTLRRLLELVATLIGLAVTLLLSWSLVAFTWRAYVGEELSGNTLTPLWIPQAALSAGAILLTIQMAARLVRVLFGEPTEDESLRAAGATE